MAKRTLGVVVLDLLDALLRGTARRPPAYNKAELKRLPGALDVLRKAGLTEGEIHALQVRMEIIPTPKEG